MFLNRHQHIIFIATVLLLLQGCIDTISLDFLETDNEYLIIDAEIRDSDRRHVVNIKLNSDQTENFRANLPVEDAEVHIIKDGSKRIDFSHRDNGDYISLNVDFEIGSSYQLNVNYQDVLYQSTPELLNASMPFGELHTEITREKFLNAANNVVDLNFINLLHNMQIPADEKVYLRYRLDGIYAYEQLVTAVDFDPVTCYVREVIDFDNISIASNENLFNGELKNHQVFKKKIDFRFAHNYCMKVYQERISETAHEFWENVIYEYTRTGDIFETPPGILRGNIQETSATDRSAIGLFSMIAVDSISYLISPVEAGLPDSECGRFGQLAESCLNCLLIPKSSLSKPECFE